MAEKSRLVNCSLYSFLFLFCFNKALEHSEIKLFKTLNQRSQLLHKMMHCLKALEMPHNGDTCWCNENAAQTCTQHAITNQLQMFCWKFSLLNVNNKSSNTIKYGVTPKQLSTTNIFTECSSWQFSDLNSYIMHLSFLDILFCFSLLSCSGWSLEDSTHDRGFDLLQLSGCSRDGVSGVS